MLNPLRTLPDPTWLGGPESDELDWREELYEAIDCAQAAARPCSDVLDKERVRLIHEAVAHLSKAGDELIALRKALMGGGERD